MSKQIKGLTDELEVRFFNSIFADEALIRLGGGDLDQLMKGRRFHWSSCTIAEPLFNEDMRGSKHILIMFECDPYFGLNELVLFIDRLTEAVGDGYELVYSIVKVEGVRDRVTIVYEPGTW